MILVFMVQCFFVLIFPWRKTEVALNWLSVGVRREIAPAARKMQSLFLTMCPTSITGQGRQAGEAGPDF
jgi:hypothetical protein